MTSKSKKALITGITGQDGIYLARFLLEKGYHVTGLLSCGHGHCTERLKILGIQDKVQLRSCVLTDYREVQTVLEELRPDEIYNLAAMSSVGASFEKPGETIDFNVFSVHAILEAMKRSGAGIRFYQASSSEMFGNAQQLPVDENSPLTPVSPYAISKATAHILTKHYRKQHQLFCSCGILFNHESMLRPEHFVTKKVLSAAVKISRGSREKLHLGNVDVRRDWGYAPAYVQAMWLMLQQPVSDDFIIASGQAHSLSEFVQAVFEDLGLPWEKFVRIDPELKRPADIREIYGHAAKAKTELGWQYNVSFKELVKTLVKDEIYYQSHYSGQA